MFDAKKFVPRKFDADPVTGYELSLQENELLVNGTVNTPIPAEVNDMLIIRGPGIMKAIHASYHELSPLFIFLLRNSNATNLILYKAGFLMEEYNAEDDIYAQYDRKNARIRIWPHTEYEQRIEWTPLPQRPQN